MTGDRAVILAVVSLLLLGLGWALVFKQAKCEPWCRRYAPCRHCRERVWRP